MRKKKKSNRTTGRLDDLNLAEIVQTLALGLKTARLGLQAGGRSGAIWLESGDVKHASSGELEGEEAFCEMVGWWSGRFVIEHDVPPPRTTIRGDATWLVMEGLRRVDENQGTRAAAQRSGSAAVWPRHLALLAVVAVVLASGLIAASLVGPPGAATSPVAIARPHRSLPVAPGPATVADVHDRIPEPPIEVQEPPAPARVERPERGVAEPQPVPRVEPREYLSARLAPAPEDSGLHWSEVVSRKPLTPDGHLDLTVRHKVKSGTLELLLDGESIYSHELDGRGRGLFGRVFGKPPTIQKRLVVAPGRRALVARWSDKGKPDRESMTRVHLRAGETLALRVEIGRGGRPLTLGVEPAVTALARPAEHGDDPQ